LSRHRAFLELETDLAAPWLLELWEAVPTPEMAKRVREATIARLLWKNRIRRHAAADVLTMLRAEPMTVADGTITAARAHFVSLIARIRLLNRQIDEAHRHLDRPTADLASAQEAEPGQVKQHDAEILASLPGMGRIALATLLAEAWDALQRRDHAAPCVV
jgi:transposase